MKMRSSAHCKHPECVILLGQAYLLILSIQAFVLCISLESQRQDLLKDIRTELIAMSQNKQIILQIKPPFQKQTGKMNLLYCCRRQKHECLCADEETESLEQ